MLDQSLSNCSSRETSKSANTTKLVVRYELAPGMNIRNARNIHLVQSESEIESVFMHACITSSADNKHFSVSNEAPQHHRLLQVRRSVIRHGRISPTNLVGA